MTFIDGMRGQFRHRIFAVDLEVGETAGRLRAHAASKGRSLHPLDSLIAATASVHKATLVTRNTKDFEALDIRILDPWLVYI